MIPRLLQASECRSVGVEQRMVAMWYTAGVIVVCALNVVWSEMSREDLISAREGGKHDCYDKKMRPQVLYAFESSDWVEFVIRF